jgi:hypothetical protein
MGRRETDHQTESDNDSQPSYRDTGVETPSPPAREKALTPEEVRARLEAFKKELAEKLGWK